MSVRMVVSICALALGLTFEAFAQVRPGSADADLFDSVQRNDLAGVRASLDAGADVFATNAMGNRPADVAVDSGFYDIAHYLLSVMDHKRATRDAAPPPVGDPVLGAPPPTPFSSEPLSSAPSPPMLSPSAPAVMAQRPAPQPQPAQPPKVPGGTGPNPFDVGVPPASQPAPQSTPGPNAKRVVEAPPPPPPPPAPPSTDRAAEAQAQADPVELAQPQVRLSAVRPSEPQPPQVLRPAPKEMPESQLHIDEQGNPIPGSQTPPPLSVAAPQAEPTFQDVRAAPAPKPAAESAPVVEPVATASAPVPEPIPVSTPAPAPVPEPASEPAVELEPQATPALIPVPTPAQAVPEPAAQTEQARPQEASPKEAPPEEAQAQKSGWMDRLTGFFDAGDQADKTAQDENAVEPVETASLPLPEPEFTAAPSRADAVARGAIQLTPVFKLGKAQPEGGAGEKRPCVSKGRHGFVCVEDAAWPDGLATYFGTMKSNLYRGSKIVVGYEGGKDQGQASFMYAVFRSHGFEEVLEVFAEHFGPPDLISQRGIRPFQGDLQPNPVRTWYGFDPDTGREIVLEVVKYDDNRGTFPVMDEGAVKLSYIGTASIFRYTVPIELQRLN